MMIISFIKDLIINYRKHISFKNYNLTIPPLFIFDYPLNLSISISGGKENNYDFPSNGEWIGKSSYWKSIVLKKRQLNCSIFENVDNRVGLVTK